VRAAVGETSGERHGGGRKGAVMSGGSVPLKVVWALLAAGVLAVGAVAFVVGAFVVNSRETVREVIRAPPTDVTVIPGVPTELPKPDGPPPSNKAEARAQVTRAVEIASAGTSTPEERRSRIDDDSSDQEALRREIPFHFPQVPLDGITARVEEVRFLNRKTAAVRYTIVLPGYLIAEIPNRIGRVVLVDRTWKVTRETACSDLALGGVTCPPKE
jgi:hypothetical protein